MTFLRKVTAASGKIKTSEPIKITWEAVDGIFCIAVDGIDYAVIQNVSSADEVDLAKVKEWVEETYYDGDYKSPQYMPAPLKLKDFKA